MNACITFCRCIFNDLFLRWEGINGWYSRGFGYVSCEIYISHTELGS